MSGEVDVAVEEAVLQKTKYRESHSVGLKVHRLRINGRVVDVVEIDSVMNAYRVAQVLRGVTMAAGELVVRDLMEAAAMLKGDD